MSNRDTLLRWVLRSLPLGGLPALARTLPAGPRRRILDHALGRVDLLGKLLWGGFSAAGQARLAQVIAQGHPRLAPRARWHLARWYLAQGRAEQAEALLAPLTEGAGADGMAARTGQTPVVLAVTRAEILRQLGRPGPARALLTRALQADPDSPELCLALASLCAEAGAEAEWLGLLNRVLAREGLAPLRFAQGPGPASGVIDPARLTAAPVPPDPGSDQAMISVIMPVWKPGPGFEAALASLCAQSWHNLEILIVDDANPAPEAARIAAQAALDPRIRVLTQSRNRGAYAARNLGLEAARGALVTVQDADDWTHPQKLAIQARHLLDTPETPANATAMARVDAAGRFVLPHDPASGIVRMNYSSVMLRRDLLARLGGWDAVRIAADSELLGRLRHAFGPGAVPLLAAAAPLSLARHEPGSLTGVARTGLLSFAHGVRGQYALAARDWLEARGSAFPALPPADMPRPFPAPGFILPERRDLDLDLLLVMDTNRPPPGLGDPAALCAALAGAGHRVGVFHWPRLPAGSLVQLQPPVAALRRLAGAGRITLVCPGEEGRVGLALWPDPGILADPIDLPPCLQAEANLIRQARWSRLSPATEAERIFCRGPVERVSAAGFAARLAALTARN